jgi:hypothetical protein
MQVIVQVERTTKLLGFSSLSAQVPGQPDVAYELPAQSPVSRLSVEPWVSEILGGAKSLTAERNI